MQIRSVLAVFALVAVAAGTSSRPLTFLRQLSGAATGDIKEQRCRVTTAQEVLEARAGVFNCPVELPTKTGADFQKGYFLALHKAIVDGNGPMEGCRNGAAQEHYVKAFQDELMCLYATLLADKCGGLPSKFGARQKKWEAMCLDPMVDLLTAYDLMDATEKKYFFKFKKAAEERQIHATYFELASYKELACMFMKTVDDECVTFRSPRLLPPSSYAPKKKVPTGDF